MACILERSARILRVEHGTVVRDSVGRGSESAGVANPIQQGLVKEAKTVTHAQAIRGHKVITLA